jgi:membrane protein
MKKIKRWLKKIYKILKLEEMQILPGQLAFFLVVSVFAMLPLIALIGSGFVTREFAESLKDLPVGVASVFKDLLDTDSTGYNVFLFMAISLFFSSSGCKSIIVTSNVIYKITENNKVKQGVKAFIMTIILMFIIVFTAVVPAFGDLILTSIKNKYPGDVINLVIQLFDILKYPLSFLLIFIGVKLIYTMAPDMTIKSKYTNRGALFTTVLWVVITRIYAIYLNNINTYNIFYGSLANVVIVLFWFYLLSYVFTMGMALNASSYFDYLADKKKEEEKE